MLRIYILILYMVVAGVAIYAWRDWFAALCGLILLMAILEHHYMPRTIMGIRGLNVWNVLMFCILVAWAARRRSEGIRWDMPRYLTVLLLAYLVIFLIAFLRMIFDRSVLTAYGYTLGDLISERLINSIKWVIPGLLLFDGCRTPRRLKMAIVSICLLYFLLALQVAHYMPIKALWEFGEMEYRMDLPDTMGLHPTLLGKAFAGGAWATLSASLLLKRKRYKAVAFGGFLVITLGQALVGSRSGFAAWGAAAVTLCAVRWRRYLLAAPIVLIIFFCLLPGPASRLLSGFGQTDVAGGHADKDEYTITSGRNLIWPYVLDKIGESPIIGHGRDATRRTGVTEALQGFVGRSEAVGHAHNAYLDLLLESGLVGLSVVMLFYGIVVFRSVQMFRVRDNPMCAATGGMALAFVVSHLAAGIGSESFFPYEGDLGIWCSIGLVLRVAQEYARARRQPADIAFGEMRSVNPPRGMIAAR
jgi:O-antigen ligase